MEQNEKVSARLDEFCKVLSGALNVEGRMVELRRGVQADVGPFGGGNAIHTPLPSSCGGRFK